DDGELKLLLFGLLALADDDRYLGEAGQFGGAQTSLTGDEFVFAIESAVLARALAAGDGQRLQDAVHPDRLRQLLELGLIELSPRLEGVRYHLIELHPQYRISLKCHK